jgi:hypothetical protein
MAVILQVRQRSSFSSYDDALPDPMLLEAGDKVARTETGFEGPQAYIYTVERITPTQIVLEGRGGRYYRSDGSAVGGRHSQRLLHVGHPEVLAAQQADALRRLKAKQAEVLGARMTSSADRILAARKLEMYARQALERIELLDRQMAQSQAEIDELRAERGATR